MKQTKFSQSPQSVIAVYADDKKGLVGQLLNLFNRPYFKISCLNVARTDINDIVLITLEVVITGQQLQTILHKMERIIEVYKAIAWPADEAGLTKVGYYRVSFGMLGDALWQQLQTYGAAITKVFDDSLVITKTGNEESLRQLYNQLEGQYLISYCQTALITENSLLKLDAFFSSPIELDLIAG